jgi:hypothetical protein
VSLATLRSRRVGIYTYRETLDPATRIASSYYLKLPSPDADGLWWGALGTVFGREAAPVMKPQDQQIAMWSFALECPVLADDLVVDGSLVYRVESLMLRTLSRSQKQAYCTMVDDANSTFDLREIGSFSFAFDGAAFR